MIHVCKDELEWTSLRPQHQIDVFNISFKLVCHLTFGKHHQTHHAYPECEEYGAKRSL